MNLGSCGHSVPTEKRQHHRKEAREGTHTQKEEEGKTTPPTKEEEEANNTPKKVGQKKAQRKKGKLRHRKEQAGKQHHTKRTMLLSLTSQLFTHIRFQSDTVQFNSKRDNGDKQHHRAEVEEAPPTRKKNEDGRRREETKKLQEIQQSKTTPHQTRTEMQHQPRSTEESRTTQNEEGDPQPHFNLLLLHCIDDFILTSCDQTPMEKHRQHHPDHHLEGRGKAPPPKRKRKGNNHYRRGGGRKHHRMKREKQPPPRRAPLTFMCLTLLHSNLVQFVVCTIKLSFK